MADSFARIAFTPNVKALQTRMGSRAAYARPEAEPIEPATLSPYELAFLAARDSFYMGRSTATPTSVPAAWLRRMPGGSAPSWCRTRPSACSTSTRTR